MLPLDSLRAALATLAEQKIFLGTSSWKYPGWIGQLYDEQRYLYRGKIAHSRFEQHCLEEYAQTFRTVCVDAGYYQFPSPHYLDKLCAQVPDDFCFSFKVTDEITARTFPKLPRHGTKGGQSNPHFLDADLFQRAFLASCTPHRHKIGVLIFEFSRFHRRDFDRGRDFVDQLDRFFSNLPSDWQYGVEIRNPSLLQPDYFDVLRHHQVTHVFNNWQRMPSVAHQMEMPSAHTTDFSTARFLLQPGRTYQQAVDTLAPYNTTREVNHEARRAAAALIRHRQETANARATRPSFLFINNRLEGNALNTILAILEHLGHKLM